MRFKVTVPKVAQAARSNGVQARKDLRAAAIIATDRASRDAQRAVQARIRGVGLGRLANAVGHTSKKKGDGPANSEPFGGIFARGGDESLAGGALQAYSRGATITARRGQWLAFATPAIPKFVSVGGRRFRATPELYRASSLASSIGPLVFKPIGTNRAVLVVKKVTLSPKTGRAKAATGRKTRTRIPAKEVVAFVLIRVTRRAQRFDKDQVVALFAKAMPRYLQEALDEILSRRA